MAALKRKSDGREDIIVGSVQTLFNLESGILDKFDLKRLEWLIIDEAHHSPASSYGVGISHFLANPFTTLVGFTATPNRADGIAMGSVFDEIVFQYGMYEGIQDGWLSDIHGFHLHTGTDISHVGKGGDEGGFNNKQLVQAINTPARNEAIVKGWIMYCWPRQTIVFTEDIQHALDLTTAFKRQGIKAEAVWGKGRKWGESNRKEKIEAFRRGDIQVLINSQLLIEGFDMWQVEAVIPAYPTKSQGRLIQQVGRGTRLQEGISNLNEWRQNGWLTEDHKQNCLVMDPIDVLGRHTLATLPSLFGLSPKLDLKGQSVAAVLGAIKAAQAKFPDADISSIRSLEDLDNLHLRPAHLWKMKFAEEVKGFAKLQWTKRLDGQYRLALPKADDYFAIREDMIGKCEIKGKMAGEVYNLTGVSSLAEAVKTVETMVSTKQPDYMRWLGREERWRKGPVTTNQRNLLMRKPFNYSPGDIVRMTAGDAYNIINKKFNKNA